MHYALSGRTEHLDSLVSVDVAPKRYAGSHAFRSYVKAMIAIEEANVKQRKEADRMLQSVAPVPFHFRFHHFPLKLPSRIWPSGSS